MTNNKHCKVYKTEKKGLNEDFLSKSARFIETEDRDLGSWNPKSLQKGSDEVPTSADFMLQACEEFMLCIRHKEFAYVNTVHICLSLKIWSITYLLVLSL